MTNRILLALDGSPTDALAFSQARRIAAGGSEIHLLHVVPSRPVPVGTPLLGMVDVAPAGPVAVGEAGADAHVRGAFPSSAPESAIAGDESGLYAQAVRYLEGYRRRLRGISGQDLVRTGAPTDAILEVALTFGIDLIVMSTHARTGIARWFMGSISDAILRRSQLPVLLVRNGLPERSDRVRRILVPVSGAPESRAILSAVKPLAVRANAEILLLEVVDPIHPGRGLEEVGRDIESSGASWRPLRAHGDPTEVILRYSKSHNADLIAMSTPARKIAFQRSVPRAVLARSDRAVLLQSPVLHAERRD